MRSEYDVARRKTEAYRQAERERLARRMSDPRYRAEYRRKARERRAKRRAKAPPPTCPDCGVEQKRKGRCERCRRVRRKEVYAKYKEKHSARGYNLSNKKLDAKKRGIPFALSPIDLPPVPAVCPALGVPFSAGRFGLTLDRIDSAKGYVPGNIQWLSKLANAIKSDASANEVAAVAEFMRRRQLLG